LDTTYKSMLARVKHVLMDIDGTLVPGKGIPMLAEQWSAIKNIADTERNITIGLNTGRNIEYAARFSELLGTNGIIIGESGGIVYSCRDGSFTYLVDKGKLESLARASLVLDKYVDDAQGTKEQKKTMLSYKPPEGKTAGAFSGELRAALAAHDRSLLENLEITYSKSAVDITCKGTNKGNVIYHVAKMLGIGIENMLFIGDGANDLPAFRVVAKNGGICMAPANASQEVREYFDVLKYQGKPAYISSRESTAAVLEILTFLHEINLDRSEGKSRMKA